MAESENHVGVDAKDVLRIMVATDSHLGFGEKDAVRGEDSFTAFEEMLQMAVEEDVDFILLGGDLFHDAVPTQNALNKCIKLLRHYTFGDKPIEVEFLSQNAHNFHNAINESVNYEDPNLNISIPVFSIHGNHDDPSGFGRLSSLDVLSSSGLVNYFGRWTDLTEVEIKPLLLRKGATQLALYGLSHIHDQRLARLFQNHKVLIDEEEGNWFHLLVLHQNRADRGPKNYIPEHVLPEFLNLVIWGHEHDCRIEPELVPNKEFYITQPGSSVATSLSEGESLPKKVAILEIHKEGFQLKPMPLQTVRPFVFESIDLAELVSELGLDEGDASNKVKKYAEERIEEMIERAKKMLTGHPRQPLLPLIRLRIIFSSEDQMFNAIRFGQSYNERVANPAEIVLFKKGFKKVKKEEGSIDPSTLKNTFEEMEIDTSSRVEDFVERYFERAPDSQKLQVMPSKALTEICFRLAERKDLNAAEHIVKYIKERAVETLMEKMPEEDALGECLSSFRAEVTHDDILKMLDERGNTPANFNKDNGTDSNDLLFCEEVATSTPPPMATRGRPRNATASRGGRGGRGGAASASAAAKAAASAKAAAAAEAAAAAAASSRTRASPRSRKQELDVTVNSARTPRQKSALDLLEKKTQPTRSRKIATYVVSDSDDSM